jgi:hypothetical protein
LTGRDEDPAEDVTCFCSCGEAGGRHQNHAALAAMSKTLAPSSGSQAFGDFAGGGSVGMKLLSQRQ